MPTYTPYAHQQYTIDFYKKFDRVFDASDMGTGKSFCVIYDTEHRLLKNPMSKTLILAPKSLLETVWQSDFVKFMPHIVTSVAVAPTEKREAAFARPANVYITNVDALVWLSKRPVSFWNNFDAIIVDESTAIKNDSARTKAAIKIRKYFKYRRCLSGTPTAGLLTDLFFQYLFLDDGASLGVSFTKFRNQVLIAKQTGPHPKMVTWSNKPGREKVLAYLLKPMTIRHVLEDVVDMPPIVKYTYTFTMNANMRKAYQELKTTAQVTLATGTVNAINAAALTTKLLQCLSADTEVLTDTGWKQIISITKKDLLWDGSEWVSNDGVLNNGLRPIIQCWGVTMTPDHKILTNKGWKLAKEINNGKPSDRFNRSNFQLPNSYKTSRIRESKRKYKCQSNLALQMYMRKKSSTTKSKFKKQNTKNKIVWLQNWIRNSISKWFSWKNKTSVIQSLVKNARTLQFNYVQRLFELWRTWNTSMQKMGFFPKFSFGYGISISPKLNVRSNKQQQRIFQGKLSMEYSNRTRKQYSSKCNNKYAERENDSSSSSRNIPSNSCSDLSTHLLRVAEQRKRYTSTIRVYDILNAGPKNQFLIRNKQGFEFISHNCASGAIIDSDTGVFHLIDTQRYDLVLDLVSQTKHSVVFYNWRHQREYMVAQAKKRGITYTYIDGSVSFKKRKQIIDEYQDGKYDTIFLQLKSSSHGLTLTRATHTIWSCPSYLSDYYKQANRRVYRIGQDKRTTIINIEALNTLDHIVYEKLQGKLSAMELLTEAL